MLLKACSGMLQVIPEPEFEAWYQALPAPLAEEVATAIDLAASSGGLLAPERLSRLLLWFDGTGDHGPESPRSYVAWHHEILLCLDAAAFKQRLLRLEPAPAASALRQIERLKRKLHALRVSSSYNAWRDAAAARQNPTPSSIRHAFLELLGTMQLDPDRVIGSGSALRELCIDGTSPRLRVLFGLDLPRQRLIAISGEALDRSYYGDSVRLAERRWQRYLDVQLSLEGPNAP